ncbi:NADH:quinone oxidoreductase [Pseudomonas sp. MAFF212428]|uniref:NADH:quinone oxidoreductase n=1 Tax=Pseudomonas brassicae TaxID=2708063 RepID=A0A6B3NWE4_9PSED|nr:Rnf-Nqr domain containing protein [Pseudomonas brassicae]NER61736.1 NADH:quinone oxidoreductase [Pseudomonas brassicae]NER64550.1 NADH:quinone oxidoreductase [Pseudomonas brassicae]
MTELLLTLLSAALVNNVVLHQALGLDPLLQSGTALQRQRVHALGLATLVMLLLAIPLGQLLYLHLLRPLALEYLRLFVFMPLCVLLIAPILSLLQRQVPGWPFARLKPLLLGNAALLGLALQVSDAAAGLLTSVALSLGSGLGFWLVLSLFDDLCQRSDAVPAAFRGLPISLIGAGIMALAFLGFNGLFTP